jgi:hypothetical protein
LTGRKGFWPPQAWSPIGQQWRESRGGFSTLPATRPMPSFGGGMSTLPAPWRGGGYLGAPPNIYGTASGSFYPQARVGSGPVKPYSGFQGGISDLSAPGIGAGYGPPPQLQSGDIGTLIAALKREAQKQGLSGSQIQGLLSAFQGMGGAGSSAEVAGLGSAFGGGVQLGASDIGLRPRGAYPPAYKPYGLEGAPEGYQGGISDIGYPPMIGPSMDYHADKGSSWIGPYDPNYIFNRQP